MGLVCVLTGGNRVLPVRLASISKIYIRGCGPQSSATKGSAHVIGDVTAMLSVSMLGVRWMHGLRVKEPFGLIGRSP